MTFAIVDEASYQDANGEPDFAAAKKAGLVGVFIKATDGVTYTNPYFQRDAVDAAKAGLLVGAYHFLEPRDDAATQAQFFLNTVAKLPAGTLHFRHVLDTETIQGCSPAQVSACGAGWLRVVQNHVGWQPLVYTYPNFAQNGYCQGLGGYPLWLASYTTTHVPPPPWSKWVLVQTGQGPEAGFSSGPVDQDQAPDLTPLLVPGATPPAQPAPTTPEDDPDVFILRHNTGEFLVKLSDNGTYVNKHIATPAEAQALVAAGYRITQVDDEQAAVFGIS